MTKPKIKPITVIAYLSNIQMKLFIELEPDVIMKNFHNGYPLLGKDNYGNSIIINSSRVPILRILDKYDPTEGGKN